jgi:hypothetical protein
MQVLRAVLRGDVACVFHALVAHGHGDSVSLCALYRRVNIYDLLGLRERSRVWREAESAWRCQGGALRRVFLVPSQKNVEPG